MSKAWCLVGVSAGLVHVRVFVCVSVSRVCVYCAHKAGYVYMCACVFVVQRMCVLACTL